LADEIVFVSSSHGSKQYGRCPFKNDDFEKNTSDKIELIFDYNSKTNGIEFQMTTFEPIKNPQTTKRFIMLKNSKKTIMLSKFTEFAITHSYACNLRTTQIVFLKPENSQQDHNVLREICKCSASNIDQNTHNNIGRKTKNSTNQPVVVLMLEKIFKRHISMDMFYNILNAAQERAIVLYHSGSDDDKWDLNDLLDFSKKGNSNKEDTTNYMNTQKLSGLKKLCEKLIKTKK
jgi:hypothetical protein